MNERSFIVKWPFSYEAISATEGCEFTPPIGIAGSSANCQIAANALNANNAYNAVSKMFLFLSSD